MLETAEPLNKTAALVVQKGDPYYTPQAFVPSPEILANLPPMLEEIPQGVTDWRDRYGRYIVVGILKERSKCLWKKVALRWVALCIGCGTYSKCLPAKSLPKLINKGCPTCTAREQAALN